MARSVFLLAAASAVTVAIALCPFSDRQDLALPRGHIPVRRHAVPNGYRKAVEELDLEAVKEDIKELLTTSSDDWPADYGDYGPFFVRLAWHCAGSYRTSDGRGGCDGGRQRFDPERSWEDNTNLDKARALLEPIKVKYGLGLSWGDLIILAGTTAIESMGGPVLGFCAGRIDDPDGTESVALGPTAEQEVLYPCPVNGECEEPLGSSTIGLIYLNPEGPMGKPKPDVSAGQVRDTFARMAMNDTETVALIGGGHAFGKTHGACPDGPGPSPKDDPLNPWPGMCGTGKGTDAFTSGFEGPWTTNPTSWDNEYFHNLLNYNWSVHTGPGGHFQWGTENPPVAPAADGNGEQPIMMMTSDISLLSDPTGEYQKIVQDYAASLPVFDAAFEAAWYKLTTRDMGPRTRCLGSEVPPAQDWQYPLPPTPENLANFSDVRAAIEALLDADKQAEVECAPAQAWPYQCTSSTGQEFVRLAYRCSATFRQTDYLGGCDGARIRFAPESEWPANQNLDAVLEVLEPVKSSFGAGLSWADLIVLAGSVALEDAGVKGLDFCPGRTDAPMADGGSDYLEPKLTGDVTDDIEHLKESVAVAGLSQREFVALVGAGNAARFSAKPSTLDNTYFVSLLAHQWVEFVAADGVHMYKAADNPDLVILHDDLLIKTDAELLPIVQDFASDSGLFLSTLAAAWVKLVNSDRFDGPASSLC